MRTVTRMIATTQRAQRPFSEAWPKRHDTVINMQTQLQMETCNAPFLGTHIEATDDGRFLTSRQWFIHIRTLTGFGLIERPMRDVVRW